MPFTHTMFHYCLRGSRAALLAGALLATTATMPVASLAQTSGESSVYYAITDLNLRKGPGNTDAVFAVVPAGGELRRAAGEVTNEYMPVTYNGSTGWVLELGLALPVAAEPDPAAEPEPALDLYQRDTRVTLAPLMLRTGPNVSAEPIAGMPEGSLVTLTREGYENGYVTVDYGGALGWAYADFLARLDEVN